MTVKEFVCGVYQMSGNDEDVVTIMHEGEIEFGGGLEGLVIDEPLWFMHREVLTVTMVKQEPIDKYNIAIFI